MSVRRGVPVSEDQNYTVGYKKPPKKTQWKKGQSGFPSGRPKGSIRLPDFNKALAKKLSETVTVVKNGKSRKMTKLDAGLEQFVNKLARGDAAAFKVLLGLKAGLADHGPAAAAALEDRTEAVRARIAARLNKMRKIAREEDAEAKTTLNNQVKDGET